ncbi:MAG: DNA primase [Alphaproteobacteria bacterium]
MYSPALLAEIKRRLPLSEIIGKIVLLRKKGHEYHGLCPFHQEKTPSFTVNNGKEFYHCFGCGQHGSVFDFLIHQNHLTFTEAVQKAAEMAGVSLPALRPDSKEKDTLTPALLQVLETACQFFQDTLLQPQGKEALRYVLDQRKISNATLQKFRLGLAPADKDGLKNHLLNKGHDLNHIQMAGLLSQWDDGTWHDKFRNRLMFPITNPKGHVIAFGGRLLGPGEPKYLNSPETPVFHKGNILYNWAHAQNSAQKKNPLVVVEGYMDVISLTQHGYERVVAPLGTALTETQIQSLWKMSSEPLLCFDGDDAGQRAARRAAERALPFLKPGMSVSFLPLPATEDPDTFIQKNGLSGWHNLLAQAQPLADLLWSSEIKEYKRHTPEERALLEKTLEGFAQQIQDPLVKSYYNREFKNRLFEWGRAYKKPVLSPGSARNKKPHKINVMQLQERILLATFILHPALENTLHEEFAFLTLATPEYDQLHQEILNYFSMNLPLEKDTLTTYLRNKGHDQIVNVLLGNDIFLHAPFLSLESLSHVLEGWRQVYDTHRHKQGKKEELQDAKQRLQNHLSPEEWERYKRLKESFVTNADDTEF